VESSSNPRPNVKFNRKRAIVVRMRGVIVALAVAVACHGAGLVVHQEARSKPPPERYLTVVGYATGNRQFSTLDGSVRVYSVGCNRSIGNLSRVHASRNLFPRLVRVPIDLMTPGDTDVFVTTMRARKPTGPPSLKHQSNFYIAPTIRRVPGPIKQRFDFNQGIFIV
jgi:hypothetical protein